MLKKIFNKVKSTKFHLMPVQSSMLLGRWSTITKDDKKKKDNTPNIMFNVDAGNHDHCGSELCVKTPIKNIQKTPEKNKNEKQNFNMTEQDMFPYII